MERMVDRAAIVLVAHDIRMLLTQGPERLLWSPGRPIWGVTLVPETTKSGRALAVVSIDGCMDIAHLAWPGHFVPHGDYELDALVRALGDLIRLARPGGETDRMWFTSKLPGASSGDCCVLVSQEDLPWIAKERSESLGEGVPIWTAPGEPGSSAQLLPIHPWLSLGGLRGAQPSASEFYSAVGEPPEMQVLPAPIRQDRLVAYWRLHAIHESGRLVMAGQDVPEWIREDSNIQRLTKAWVFDRWRGPGEPQERVSHPEPIQETAQPSGAPEQPPAAEAAAPEVVGEEPEAEVGSW